MWLHNISSIWAISGNHLNLITYVMQSLLKYQAWSSFVECTLVLNEKFAVRHFKYGNIHIWNRTCKTKIHFLLNLQYNVLGTKVSSRNRWWWTIYSPIHTCTGVMVLNHTIKISMVIHPRKAFIALILLWRQKKVMSHKESGKRPIFRKDLVVAQNLQHMFSIAAQIKMSNTCTPALLFLLFADQTHILFSRGIHQNKMSTLNSGWSTGIWKTNVTWCDAQAH